MGITGESENARSRDLGATVWLVALVVVIVLLSVSGRYGFHRDELYFLMAGRRLDWGFVDQPPLTPLVARLAEIVGGTSPAALRVLPALAVAGVVVLAAAMTRRFGGGAPAQVYSAVAAGGAGVVLAVGHLLSTATFDLLLWTVATWVLVRILDDGDPRWWLAFGATVGVGMENKFLIGVFAVVVVLSLVVTTGRRVLRGWWPVLGGVVAVVLAAPTLVWQATNGFPQLDVARSLAERGDGPVVFMLLQVGLLSIVLTLPAAVGLWRLMRSPSLVRWRPIGVVFVALLMLFLVTGGKAYYVAPMYPALLAAGAVWFESLGRVGRRVMGAATAVGIGVGMLVALPLLPPSQMSTLDATGELGETVGWPELVDQVTAVYESIPADRRADVAIFTGSYGEAGAIDVLGPPSGLPGASSGHNSYWLWGPPTSHGAVIGVGEVGDVLRRICPETAEVGRIDNPYGVENEEAGLPLFLCLDPEGQLSQIWDDVRHYN
jgi:4-amino-4-deoxy-L-arabinose transferase-like glycosyltransferase